MNALQINRHNVDNQSPKEALRAHIDQLPPEKQYEFILSALQLISDRSAMRTVEAPIGYPALSMRKRAATH